MTGFFAGFNQPRIFRMSSSDAATHPAVVEFAPAQTCRKIALPSPLMTGSARAFNDDPVFIEIIIALHFFVGGGLGLVLPDQAVVIRVIRVVDPQVVLQHLTVGHLVGADGG